jgi:hypothetical protein
MEIDRSGDLVSLQEWMFEYVGTAHPFLHSAQQHPNPIVRVLRILLVYGEALFLKYREDLMTWWEEFGSSEKGDIKWDLAMRAALMHCHVCILRELHDIPDNALCYLLSNKHLFYQSLATVNIATLIQKYGEKDSATRNLMLDMMLITSQARQETDSFFAERAMFVSMAIQTDPMWKMPRDAFPELENLLKNDEIKSVFLTLNRKNRRIEGVYDSTLRTFMNSLYFTNINTVFKLHGITLTGRVVILDSETYMEGEHCEVLSKGYRILSALHEFVHFFLKASTRNVSEFISTGTPRTDPTSKTQVRRLIQLKFPIDDQGETCYLLERHLFGEDLEYINVAAAEKLREMTREPKPLKTFRKEFIDANNLPADISPRMRL